MSANKDVSTSTPKSSKRQMARRRSTIKKSAEAKLPLKNQPEKHSITQPEIGRKVDGQEDELLPLVEKSDGARPPSAVPGLQSKATATKKRSAPARPSVSTKKLRMVDQSTQTQILSGHDNTTAPAPISNNECPASISTTECPAAPPQGYLDLLNAFITRHQSGPAPKELWDQPGYTEADENQRQQMLNEFICENLENPEFIQLCEDAEKAWRRMGFGM